MTDEQLAWQIHDAVNPIGCCEMTLDEIKLVIRMVREAHTSPSVVTQDLVPVANKDGALPLRDRATAAEPKVSALRDGIPSAECAVIVAWMRWYAGCLIRDQERAVLAAANAIERGDHVAQGEQ